MPKKYFLIIAVMVVFVIAGFSVRYFAKTPEKARAEMSVR
jgi:hypothetical protein